MFCCFVFKGSYFYAAVIKLRLFGCQKMLITSIVISGNFYSRTFGHTYIALLSVIQTTISIGHSDHSPG